MFTIAKKIKVDIPALKIFCVRSVKKLCGILTGWLRQLMCGGFLHTIIFFTHKFTLVARIPKYSDSGFVNSAKICLSHEKISKSSSSISGKDMIIEIPYIQFMNLNSSLYGEIPSPFYDT